MSEPSIAMAAPPWPALRMGGHKAGICEQEHDNILEPRFSRRRLATQALPLLDQGPEAHLLPTKLQRAMYEKPPPIDTPPPTLVALRQGG